jgi:hypothetical protein
MWRGPALVAGLGVLILHRQQMGKKRHLEWYLKRGLSVAGRDRGRRRGRRQRD